MRISHNPVKHLQAYVLHISVRQTTFFTNSVRSSKFEFVESLGFRFVSLVVGKLIEIFGVKVFCCRRGQKNFKSILEKIICEGVGVDEYFCDIIVLITTIFV